MKVIECCLFYNENRIASIKIDENKSWVNELHITECDKTHSYLDKPYYFTNAADMVRYHKIPVTNLFKKPGLGLSRKFPFIQHKHRKWINEGINRNLTSSFLNVDDDDVIILSDIDEIINSEFSDQIVREVKKRGIITIKMHYTVYYLNLFCKNKGAPDWSYRVFIMTGKYFKSMNCSHDQLRKKGERGLIMNEIYCLPEFAGFHHSWLGNVDAIVNKFKAYSHSPVEFDSNLINPSTRDLDRDYIARCIADGLSIFGDMEPLERRNIPLLKSVESLRLLHPDLFIN